jgi:DNA polymerase III epsilon subunit-like protein
MWYERFYRAYGPHPSDYLCFDCETTGLSIERDLPVQIGHCLVHNRKVVHKGSYYLNWLKHPSISRGQLADQLDRVAASFARNGKTFHITLATLLQEGIDPLEALRYYLELFRENGAGGGVLVGHNIIRFDWPMLFDKFDAFLSEVWTVDPDSLWDVGVIEKARQLQLWPNAGEDFLSFQRRAHRAYSRGKAKWSSEHCIAKYGLADRHNLDTERLHDAEFDSYVSHLLFEAQREAFEQRTALDGGNNKQGSDVSAMVRRPAGQSPAVLAHSVGTVRE